MNKICFLIGNINHAGGTERITSTVANGLVENVDNIFILSLIEGLNPFFHLHDKISIHSLYSKKTSLKKNYLSAIFKIRSFLKTNNIDTLIVVDSISCIFTIPALFGLNIKHICWEHFSFIDNNGSPLRGWGRKLAAKYCDQIIVLTQRDKQLWSLNLRRSKEKLIVIPNIVEGIHSVSEPTLNKKNVISVGRLVNVKGFDLLLDAWKLVSEKCPDWTLTLIGGGEEEINLKNRSNSLNINHKVKFIGQVTDVNEYYNQSSIFCLSSRFEGFGLVLIEAQSHALPIVAFNCEVGPAEILHCGIDGYLVKPEDIQELASALLKMINLSDLEYGKMSSAAFSNSKKYRMNEIRPYWISLLK